MTDVGQGEKRQKKENTQDLEGTVTPHWRKKKGGDFNEKNIPTKTPQKRKCNAISVHSWEVEAHSAQRERGKGG